MKRSTVALIAVLPLAFCTYAVHAANTVTFELGEVIARLHDTPCVDNKMQEVLREPARFQSADIVWQGKPFAACWVLMDNQIIVVDETGDAGVLPQEGFRRASGPV